VTNVVAPPASAGHALVYAPDLELTLLVNAGLGGMSGPAVSAQTRVWGWNGMAWTVLDSAGPPVRNLGGVAYDSRRRVLVMHGGSYDLANMYGETWEWSRTGGWRRINISGPGVIDHTQMTFDVERGVTVLFGGQPNPQSVKRETWEYDGTSWRLATSTGPVGRVHHALQYDPVTKRVLLFGGYAPGGSDLGDTWSWDGTAWIQLAGGVPPRTHASMAYHRRLGGMLLVGGMNVSSGVGALIRRTSGWADVPASPQPQARYLTGVAYDERRDVLVLFGGGDAGGNALFADTWEFDGTSWRRVQP
jgi:hypothetical protein